ncbi:hypothetical protein F5Y16DRAFT_391181, partial [Xylariaceae sp. FL0255]
MFLSQQTKDIIPKLPLKDTLEHIRHKLRDSNNASPGQEDVASLLSTLVGSPAAYSLPFPDGSGNVAAKLFSIQQHVRGGLVKLDHFYPLVHRIVSGSSDI